MKQRPQGEMAPGEILRACTADCQRARDAIEAALALEQAGDSDRFWTVFAWCMPAPEGEIKLTLGGIPFGRVPAAFRYRWLIALSDAALEAARLIREHEHG
jgi:hypothetical protein